MARRSKRRREPRPPTFVWTKSDVIILLACLDYSLEQKVNLDNTAIGHIARRTGKEVTPKLIQQALKRQYTLYGREGENDTFEDFLSEGSTFLDGHADSDGENIREEIRRIETPQGRYWLRNTPLEPPSRSRTLSSNHYQRSETSTLSIHATPEFEGPGEYVVQADDAEKRANGERGKQTEAQASISSKRSSRAPSQVRTRTASLRLSIKREHAGASFAENAPNASRRPPLAANHDTGIGALEQRLAAKDEELQIVLRENMEQKHYIFTLSNRLSAAEFEYGQIRESASKAAEYSDNVLMQRDLRYENSVLKGQLEQMTSQRQTIALTETNSLRPSDRTLWQELELIATDLKDACSSVEITIPTTPINTHNITQETTEQDSWAQRVARCSFHQFLSLAITDSGVSDFHIVRALAAAGISDLVFESTFPDFLARESPILDQYRRHILAKDGSQTLYQLDILACKSVMSQEYFEHHILQTTAKMLTDKFCNALGHLISPNDQTMVGAEPDGLFPSEAHSPQTENQNPLPKVFTEAFARALKLKQGLLLSRSKYKLVFFSPGDVFDSETMMRDGDGYSALVPARALGKRLKGQWPRQGRVEEDSRIKLCLFPALYRRLEGGPAGEYGVAVSVGDCLVDCDNFVKDDTDMGKGLFSLVVKGVVLV